MSIASHGTPITSVDDAVLKALCFKDSGEPIRRDFCVSYYRPDQIELFDHWATTALVTYWIDNGIFSAWIKALKSGGEANFGREYWAAYYEFCRRWCIGGRARWAVIPDPIGTGTQELDAYIREWPDDLKPYGVPVFHTDEPTGRLLSLIDQHGRVCIGATGEHRVIGSPAFCARMDELWNAIEATFGATAPWVHMFRSLQLLLPQYDWPFAGHDSSDVARNHNRLKVYPEHYLSLTRQKADRWDRLAANRPTMWIPRHLRQQQLAFSSAA